MLNRIASGLASRVRSGLGLLGFYYVQRIKGFDPPSRPHLDDETAAWLEEQLRASRLFLEFGCGGSTLLADRLGVRMISVESDPYYAAVVRRALSRPEGAQILTPPMGLTREWGMPLFRRGRKGDRYVSAPFGHLNGEFPDLIFVDGRYRVACVLETAKQAAFVGAAPILLLDDYEGRPHYEVLEGYLGPPDRVGRAAIFRLGARPVSAEAISRHVTDAR